MCRAHAAVRQLLAQIIAETSILTIVDMEAGLEHLSRGTDRHVDTLLVVTEPYYKALETARRCAELGQELGIPQVLCVANKFRSGDDLAAMRQYAAAHRLRIVGEVPFDSAISEADLEGRSPAHMLGMPAIDAVELLATALMGERPGAAIGEAR